MVPCFWLTALFFALGRAKAADWLSGFHSLPREEREKYDRARMARDERNACLLWGAVMLLGAMGARWISGYMALVAYGIWLVLFLRDVHLDIESAYGKYRLPEGLDESGR